LALTGPAAFPDSKKGGYLGTFPRIAWSAGSSTADRRRILTG
jgi:hypothetical protein